ncbi:MAG TPA: hypothetical protein ENF16_07540 [Bacteroidetes bacterium]|nr:hypothetical protein [Bacteroidota bacterium]
MTAVRPAIVALLAYVVYDVFPHNILNWHTGLIAVIVFVPAVLHRHPALLIVLCAAAGILLYARI